MILDALWAGTGGGDGTGLEELLVSPLFIVYIIAMVVFIIIDIVLMVWVYKDAEARGMGGALWFIIILCTSWIGCLIFLIVRGNHPK